MRGSIPGRVIYGEHSGPLSLHYTEREVNAARLPASRGALRSNAAATSPSGEIPTATPCLERAGPPHASAGPDLEPRIHILLPPLGSQAVATPPRWKQRVEQSYIYAAGEGLPMLMGFMFPTGSFMPKLGQNFLDCKNILENNETRKKFELSRIVWVSILTQYIPNFHQRSNF